MSTDRDVTRIVRSWLEEGVSALPDRVLDTVLDQLPATPQRRAWWPARRYGEMNHYAKGAMAVAAVAVVMVAVIGIALMPRAGNVGGSPTALTPTTAPTPVPTSTPSTPRPTPTPASTDPSPTAAAEVVRKWPGSRPNENPAGRYAWDPDADGTAWQGPRAFTGDTSGWMHKIPSGVAFTVSLSDNAYRPGPIKLTIAGYDATYQTLSPTAEGMVTHVWLVDIDGRKLTITIESTPDTPAAGLAEAKAILDTIRLEPTNAATGFRMTFDLLAGWDSG